MVSPKILIEMPARTVLSIVRRGSCYTTRNTGQKLVFGGGDTISCSNSKKSESTRRDEPSVASQAKTSTTDPESTKDLLARYELAVRRAAQSLAKTKGLRRNPGVVLSHCYHTLSDVGRGVEATPPGKAKVAATQLDSPNRAYATGSDKKSESKSGHKPLPAATVIFAHKINSLCAATKAERGRNETARLLQKGFSAVGNSLGNMKTLAAGKAEQSPSEGGHITRLYERLKKLSQQQARRAEGVPAGCKLSLLKTRLKKVIEGLVQKNRLLAGENIALRGEVAKLRLVVKQHRIHV